MPDITVYIERLKHFVQNNPLEKVRVLSPFLLRTAIPPIRSIEGMKVNDIKRLGKRIVFDFEDELFLILHLMISGLLYWEEKGCKIPAKKGPAAFDFTNNSLLLTEVSTKKQASLHLVKGKEELKKFDRGGLEVLTAALEEFKKAVTLESHTVT